MAERILAVELVGGSVRPPYVNILKLSDVRELVKERLGVEDEELSGVQKFGKRFEFFVKEAKTFYLKNLSNCLNKKYTLRNGKVVELTQAYEETTVVRVTKLPMYFTVPKLERIIGSYGKIKNIEEEQWRANAEGNDYDGLWNGNYRIRMIVEKPIPSTLEVDRRKFEIFYPGQDQTCFRCGKAHMISQCRTPYGKRINNFKLSDFPPLSDPLPPLPPLPPINPPSPGPPPTPPPPPPLPPLPQRPIRLRVRRNSKKEAELIKDIVEIPLEKVQKKQDLPEKVNVEDEIREATPEPEAEASKELEEVEQLEKEFMELSATKDDMAEEVLVQVDDMSTSGLAKKVEIEVHHSHLSQVGVLIPTSIERVTDTASEGDDVLTPAQRVSNTQDSSFSLQLSQSAEDQMEFQDTGIGIGATMDNGKRKAKHSSDEEDGNTLRMGTGSFVNSFCSGSQSQRIKRQYIEEEQQQQMEMGATPGLQFEDG